jgi:soluble lytic murein transglycosylase
VLDLPRGEAAARLKQGDLQFIITASPSRLGELGRLHPAAAFYAGLLAQGRGEEKAAAALFRAALESPSPQAREAAAERLLPPLLENRDRDLAGALLRFSWGSGKSRPPRTAAEAGLEAAAAYILDRPGPAESVPPEEPFHRALYLLSALRGDNPGEARRELPALFLSAPAALFSAPPGDRVFPWVFAELEATAALSPAESAAIAGRLAVARGAYPQGLGLFREALGAEPVLFFRYPELLGDLGRAFQFGSSGEEGPALFLAWDRFLEAGPAAASGEAANAANAAENAAAEAAGPLLPALPPDFRPDTEALRYRLLYYAGRIRRQREQYREAAEHFTRALAFAPDPLQTDACIWYILNLGLSSDPGGLLPLIRTYRPRWHDDRYFADILDRLCRYLTAEGRWQTLGEVFSLIRDGADGETAAQYAWVLGRALSLGYVSPEDAGEGGRGAADFFRIALERGGAAFSYRARAAAALGQNISLPPAPREEKPAAPQNEEMEFLLGFFSFGAAPFAYPYIRDRAAGLETAELRTLAESLQGADRWADSIRLVSAYLDREDAGLNRRDLELAYPRPYRSIIEDTAREAGLSPALFYGLIRTESAFTPDIVSRAGAVGLAQLMPDTALDMADRLSRRGGPDYIREGAVDLRDPEANIRLGAFYLAYLRDRMENPLLALLAYNGGMGRLRRWRAAAPRLPPDLFAETVEIHETREYGRKVLSAAALYGYLYYHTTMEAVIADIYNSEKGEGSREQF